MMKKMFEVLSGGVADMKSCAAAVCGRRQILRKVKMFNDGNSILEYISEF